MARQVSGQAVTASTILLLLLLLHGGIVDRVATLPATLPTCQAADDPPPLEDEYEPFVVIKAKKIITVSGDEIDNGMLVLLHGKIDSVGRNLEYPLNAEVIDATDQVVMPGLINPRSMFGQPSLRRRGVHGDLTATQTFYRYKGVFDDILDSGYTTIALAPPGDGIPGRAVVMRIAGPKHKRELVSPSYLRVTADKADFRRALEQARKEIEKVEKAREEFEKKQAEAKKKAEQEKKKQEQEKKEQRGNGGDGDKKNGKDEKAPTTQPTTQPTFKPPPIDPKLQPLVDLIQEKEGLFALLELQTAADYVHMRDVLEKFEIAHHYLATNHANSDLEYIVERMGAAEQTVVLVPLVSRVPYSAQKLNLPRLFDEAGCKVVIRPYGEVPYEYERTLRRLAELVRAGWSREAALKAVTLHPAELLNIAERVGTLEKDKEADLIFLNADPLDPTARVHRVMIAGEMVFDAEDVEEAK